MNVNDSPLIFVLFFQLVVCGFGERAKDLMYEKITSVSGCFRKINGTHQIGCTSKRGGSTGVVHYCDNQEDLNYILRTGKAGPYIPVLPSSLFTLQNLNKLKTSNLVSGLVLYTNNNQPEYFTHDRQCPNELSNIPSTCGQTKSLWNPNGSGMLYMDIPFPVFYVEHEDEMAKIKDCFNKFNNYSMEDQDERSLCSLQLNSFMYATSSTPTCRRKSNVVTNLNPVRFCDPMGDLNIWAPLFPLVSGPRNASQPVKNFKYIIISARLDTTSMFEVTNGADSPVTGLVTLLATGQYLKKILPNNDKYDKNVLFILFNGETYDYIGSQRMLYDMHRDSFPVNIKDDDGALLPLIRPENISLFIELSQMSKDKVFVHHLKQQSEIVNFISKLKKYSEPHSVQFLDVNDSLPPASLHTFQKNLTNLPGMVLAEHQSEYVNHYYNSIYDTSTNINFEYHNITTEEDVNDIPKDSVQWTVAEIATIVANSVYEEITNNNAPSNETADVGLVNELFFCYLKQADCKVHQAIQKLKLSNETWSLYVGVEANQNFITTLAGLTMAWVTADEVPERGINCTNRPRNYAYRYYNMSASIYDLNTTKCFRSSQNFSIAVSPAFIIPDYDWTSGQYSSWAESTWADMNVRLFLKPSRAHENLTIAVGSMTFIFSLIVVYFAKTRSHILFTPPLPTEAPTDC